MMTTDRPIPQGIRQPREREVPCACCARPTLRPSGLCDSHGGGTLSDNLSALLSHGSRFALEDGEREHELVEALVATGVARTFRDGTELWLELVTP